MQYAMAYRPKVGGFPFLAECLRQSGVQKNIWELPSAQSIYVMEHGSIVNQATPLLSGMSEIPPFNEVALIDAIRTDQAGASTFPEFLAAIWKAGVMHYEVDFSARTVIYMGATGETYRESYPEVEVSGISFE